VFNQHELLTDHWDKLAEWQGNGVFSWAGGGAGPDAGPKFYSGECAILMESSAGRAGVMANADFEVGFGMLPYYDTHEGAPQNSIIGGATLWVLSGHSDEEYEAASAFFEYLSQPEVQASGTRTPAICRSHRPPGIWVSNRAITRPTPALTPRSSR
jgi:sn-glycerol 3-phosphate transport system substrate-binding protein